MMVYQGGEILYYQTKKVNDSVVIEAAVLTDEQIKKLYEVSHARTV